MIQISFCPHDRTEEWLLISIKRLRCWDGADYWYRSSTFADVIASCDHNRTCFVRNDSPHAFHGRLLIREHHHETTSLLLKHIIILSLEGEGNGERSSLLTSELHRSQKHGCCFDTQA